jgi:hypothetical protein
MRAAGITGLKTIALLCLGAFCLAACGGEPKRKIDRDEVDRGAEDTSRDLQRK